MTVSDTLGHAVARVLDDAARFARLSRGMHGAPPEPSAGRPDWWDWMPVTTRDLAEAAIAAGLWRVPR